jgi:hypothetical protein
MVRNYPNNLGLSQFRSIILANTSKSRLIYKLLINNLGIWESIGLKLFGIKVETEDQGMNHRNSKGEIQEIEPLILENPKDEIPNWKAQKKAVADFSTTA